MIVQILSLHNLPMTSTQGLKLSQLSLRQFRAMGICVGLLEVVVDQSESNAIVSLAQSLMAWARVVVPLYSQPTMTSRMGLPLGHCNL